MFPLVNCAQIVFYLKTSIMKLKEKLFIQMIPSSVKYGTFLIFLELLTIYRCLCFKKIKF